MFFLYGLLYSIALLFVFPFEYRKRPRHLRKRWLTEKFGGVERSVPALTLFAARTSGEGEWRRREMSRPMRGGPETGMQSPALSCGFMPYQWAK
jgi:hypothetical protein